MNRYNPPPYINPITKEEEDPREYADYDLDEYPCQQLLGGTGSAIYMNTDGMCSHPECNPANNEEYCWLCRGTGEGQSGGSCRGCGGTGESK